MNKVAILSRSALMENQGFSDKSNAATASESVQSHPRRKKWLLLFVLVFLILAITLGVGLGVGLTRHHAKRASGNAKQTLISATTNTTKSVEGSFWRPSAGIPWQIVLSGFINANASNSSFDNFAAIYDIDLFDTEASTISDLKSQGHFVICYFSAGSYEDWRPDAGKFTPDDYGKELDGWPGEYWLNTNSSNVRSVMRSRLDLADKKGCTGVDPDNVDGYDNDNGIGLSTSDAVDYITFLAEEAHGRNLSIGLKNAGEIVNETVYMMQWSVNEQCVQYDECDTYRIFLELDKPVFHIEYPDGAPDVQASKVNSICDDQSAQGFSTVIKEMTLNYWVEYCGSNSTSH